MQGKSPKDLFTINRENIKLCKMINLNLSRIINGKIFTYLDFVYICYPNCFLRNYELLFIDLCSPLLPLEEGTEEDLALEGN